MGSNPAGSTILTGGHGPPVIFHISGGNVRELTQLLGDIMNKEELRRKIEEAGDAIVTYKGQESNKLKYNVVTVDFSTPYIQEKRTHAQETENTVLTWAWDTDSYRLVRADLVTSVAPLASVLKNNV